MSDDKPDDVGDLESELTIKVYGPTKDQKKQSITHTVKLHLPDWFEQKPSVKRALSHLCNELIWQYEDKKIAQKKKRKARRKKK